MEDVYQLGYHYRDQRGGRQRTRLTAERQIRDDEARFSLIKGSSREQAVYIAERRYHAFSSGQS